MNYSILIELSRKTISFSYSRDDGKNQFVPYGDELVKPLAIYSSGNDLRIGKFAAAEARAGKVGAYDNIFEAIKKPASFSYRGTQYPLNKLLLFGIEQCLREFFDSILYGTEGQLEQNTAKVPISLLMSSELSDNEQAYVFSLLRNAGYSNTISLDYNTMVLNQVRPSLSSNIEKAVFVSNTGNDLFIECIDAKDDQQPKRLFDLNAKEAGKNPQIDQVVKLIWQEILYDGNSINLDYNDCLPELQNHAKEFLASGALMSQNVITFNGQTYEYFLSKNSILNGIRGNDNALGNLLLQLKSKGVDPSKSTIVLLKSAAKNSYVMRSFSDSFPSVVIFDEKKHEDMLDAILDCVKEKNYILNNVLPTNAFEVGPPPISPVEPPIKEFNREWRMTKGTACGFMRNRKPDEAVKVLEKFIGFYNSKGLDLSEAEQLLIDARKMLIAFPPCGPDDSAGGDKQTGDDDTGEKVKNYARKWREVRAEARGYLREGKKEKAREILVNFISEHRGMNLDEPKQMLKELETIPSVSNKKQAGSPTSPSQKSSAEQKTISDGEKLMREQRFKEAREWFTEKKLMAKAADCTSLIKATRQLRAYKAELLAIKNAQNLQLAKSHLDDMKAWRSIYDRYGLDTKEIDDIIFNYKSIK